MLKNTRLILLALLLACAGLPSALETPAQDGNRLGRNRLRRNRLARNKLPTDARMLRFPDVSGSHICFVYAGDIWTVPKAGGAAQRLSTAEGEEYKPRFSPDGRSIAFSANYDGNTDVYVLPTAGGLARRITHHSASDRMIDWYPDGRSILYATGMTSPTGRYSELYRTGANGGMPTRLPVPWGDNASLSPDGNTVAYTPWSRDFRTWKRYRGGMASKIWTFDLRTFEARLISRTDANDSNPMWHGDTLYYLSDSGSAQRFNIWSYGLKTGEYRQVTYYKDFDVRFPSLGPSEIVYETGGRLHLLDLKSRKTRVVTVKVVTDGATLRPHTVDASKAIRNSTVSPSGKRAAFEARGDIFTVPAEHGVTRNLTRSPGVAERYPAWSPDGKQVAYFTDRTGEYELALRPAAGGEERVLTKLGAGYKYRPQWSPDSARIAFMDQTMRLRVHEIASGVTTLVDKALWMYHGELERFRVSWSADSRWMAYARGQDNQNGAIYIYDTKGRMNRRVTEGYYDDTSPVFDPEGKYLYFLSGRTFSPIYSDIQNTWIYTNTKNLLAIPLRTDVKSPLATRNDEEGKEEKPETKEKKAGNKPEDKAEVIKPVRIDFSRFERRAVVLPVKPGRFAQLQAIKGKVLYLRRPRNGSDSRKNAIVAYDLKEREEKTLQESANSFQVAAGGKKMLVRSGSTWTIRNTGGRSGWRGGEDGDGDGEGRKKKKKNVLSLTGMQVTVDPRAEWRQIFNDAWRIQRDFFYDPGMHGVDWKAMRKQYSGLLKDCVTRWDLHFILGEMIGEINSSHTYRWGGDTESATARNVGLLGREFELVNGVYRISRIYDGAAWDSQVRSPLREAGLKIKKGTWLLAVNGEPLDATKDPWAAFQGLAGRAVALTLNDKPTLEGAREVFVTPLASDRRLRYLGAIEETRAKVHKASKGKIGYVYVPNTGRSGQTELVRQMRAQYRKDALIIDERWNGGGQLPDRFVELLNRPILNYWGVRDGRDWQSPTVAHKGPKAMLINGRAGSGGDAFPYYFKKAGCGKLIGTRTWGGLIGYTGVPRLIDGGIVIAPTFGIYDTDGKWIIEGDGVDPDIEVIAHPTKLARGGDPQLDRAVAELLAELKRNPPATPRKPAYPDRSRK